MHVHVQPTGAKRCIWKCANSVDQNCFMQWFLWHCIQNNLNTIYGCCDIFPQSNTFNSCWWHFVNIFYGYKSIFFEYWNKWGGTDIIPAIHSTFLDMCSWINLNNGRRYYPTLFNLSPSIHSIFLGIHFVLFGGQHYSSVSMHAKFTHMNWGRWIEQSVAVVWPRLSYPLSSFQ